MYTIYTLRPLRVPTATYYVSHPLSIVTLSHGALERDRNLQVVIYQNRTENV